MPTSWVAESCKYILNFIRNFPNAFQSGHTILHHPLQCMSVPVPSHPCQHIVLSVLKKPNLSTRCIVVSHVGLVNDKDHVAFFGGANFPLPYFFLVDYLFKLFTFFYLFV